MTIELKWAHLADHYVSGEGGKMSIIGIFDRIMLPVEAPADAVFPFPRSHLIAKIEASLLDGAKQTVEFRLVDGNGHELTEQPAYLTGDLGSAGPGYPLSGYLKLMIEGLHIPGLGDYEFVLSMSGKRLGSVPFVVVRQPG